MGFIIIFLRFLKVRTSYFSSTDRDTILPCNYKLEDDLKSIFTMNVQKQLELISTNMIMDKSSILEPKLYLERSFKFNIILNLKNRTMELSWTIENKKEYLGVIDSRT